jgi:hypothetical protein
VSCKVFRVDMREGLDQQGHLLSRQSVLLVFLVTIYYLVESFKLVLVILDVCDVLERFLFFGV